MTEDIVEQVPNRPAQLTVAAQLVGVAALVAAIMIAVPTFLNVLVADCEAGAFHLPAVFVCFPAR